MRLTIFFLAASCLLGANPLPGADETGEPDAATRAQWRQFFDGLAANYELMRESADQPLTLVEPAAYTWARSGAHGGTYGAVYIWTDRGAADAVACFWRYVAADGSASIVHENHSLSPVVLQSLGKDSDSWKPKAGVQRSLLADAPTPAATASARMQQMRTLCRNFTAWSVGEAGDRTELRLLPQPLYRSQSTNPDLVDGALFALVCSIGTDPEAFLLLEASKTDNGPRWHYSLARFSHMNLFVSYKDKQVWQALRDHENTMSHNADNTYWVFGKPFDSVQLEGAKGE